MPFVQFWEYYPDVAQRETRSITIPPGSPLGLPPGDYAFLETYCDEPNCDCRRVLFSVITRDRPGIQAVIGWGWEDVSFYAKWMKSGDKAEAVRLKGPELNPLSPATELAPALLDVVRNILLPDSEYIERIQRHYWMFREKIGRSRQTPGRRVKKRR